MATAISGRNYVPVRLKDTGDKPDPIKIRSERTCGHIETVCRICARQWEWDHEVFYERTAGGRALKTTKHI